MRIFITGGTGFIGSFLAYRFYESGYEVNILSRSPKKSLKLDHNISYISGNPTQEGDWQNYIQENDVIINLAGSSIFKKWTKEAKNEIYKSRILTTKNIVNAIKQGNNRNIILINASAVGYYGTGMSDKSVDERDAAGHDFLADVTKAWEEEALKAKTYCARVIITRFGIVLGKEGGMLKELLPIFKFGLGCVLGTGKQWISWIHKEDLFRIMLFVIENNSISGAINTTSPNPVTNKDLTISLKQAIKGPLILPPIPEFLIKTIYGEFGDTIIKGQRVLPEVLINANFAFKFPEIAEALNNLTK